MPDATSASSPLGAWIWGPALVAAFLLLAVIAWIAYKGRKFAGGDVFKASRWSKGNRLFPTQVLITPASVVHYTPQWVGHVEHSIHMAHVASVSIDTNLLLSNVYIETSGGTTPIRCHGHHKGDAVRMKQLIEHYQTAYYRDETSRQALDGPHGGRPRPPAGTA